MKRTLRGILAMGATKAGAVNNYRLLALGKGATIQVDEGGSNAFVVQASVADSLFNPLSGDMDLVSRPKLLASIQFQSASAKGNLEAHYVHCANGCGQHIIAESSEVLKYCPNCTCALSSGNGEADGLGTADLVSASDDDVADEDKPDSSDDQDDLAALDATDAEDDEPEESSESSTSGIRRRIRRVRRASTSGESCSDDESSDEGDEDTIAPESDDDTGEDDEVSASSADELEDSDPDVSSDDGDLDSDGDIDAITEDDEGTDESDSSEQEPLVVVASSAKEAVSIFRKERQHVSTSSSNAQAAVHCLVCSSCSGHVVADVELDECPACHSALCEPDVAQASEFEQASIDNLNGTDAAGQPPLASEGEDEGDGEGDPDSSDDSSDETSESGEELVSDSGDDVTDEDSSEDSPDEDGEGESEEDEDAGTDLALTDDSGDGLDGSDDNEIAVMNTVSESASVDSLDVSYSSRVGKEAAWTAYVDGQPVAMVSKSGAGKNDDIFDSPKFGAALIATAKVAGVKKALAELGFKSLSAKFSKSAEIKRRVEAAVAEEKAALAAKEADSNKRLEAALATAAIGLNRGFFQGKASPIKEGLFNAMQAGGLRNPERIIDNVFANHHDNYLKMLFAQAGEILKMEPPVQDSLSKTILSVNYQSVSSEADAEGLESRLAGLGTSVSSSGDDAAPQRTAPPEAQREQQSGRVQIKAAVSGLGRRHTIGR